MKDLVTNNNTLSSMEVAEMLEKDHSELLKEIQGRKDGKNVGIIPVLEKGNFHLSNYFISDTYKAGTREYKCYKITKMGCELIGNKQQGEKGILFTAKYVERFNQMEQQIIQPKLLTPTEQLELYLEVLKEQDLKVERVDQKIDNLKDNMPLFGVESDELQALVRKYGVKFLGGYHSLAYNDASLRGKVYSDIQGQLRREFGVKSYKAIKRCQLDTAKRIIERYELPIVLEDEVKKVNNQISFNKEVV